MEECDRTGTIFISPTRNPPLLPINDDTHDVPCTDLPQNDIDPLLKDIVDFKISLHLQ